MACNAERSATVASPATAVVDPGSIPLSRNTPQSGSTTIRPSTIDHGFQLAQHSPPSRPSRPGGAAGAHAAPGSIGLSYRGFWLFAMLHSWDWLYLLERRPLWDLLLLVLSLGGLALSATGIVIGWRRLGRRGNAGRHIQDAG